MSGAGDPSDMASTGIRVDAFLCDAVQESGGKLHAIGIGWSQIGGQSFPVRHGRIGVGLLIHVPYTSTNQDHQVGVQLLDEDGHALALSAAGPGTDPAMLDASGEHLVRIGATFNVGRPPELQPGDEQVIPLALQLDGIMFPHPGLFGIAVQVDGLELHRLNFRLNLVQQSS